MSNNILELVNELDSPNEAFLSTDSDTIFLVYGSEKLDTLKAFKQAMETLNPADLILTIAKEEEGYSFELKSSQFAPLIINDVNVLYINEIKHSHYTDKAHYLGFWIYRYGNEKGKEVEYKVQIEAPIITLNILDGEEPKFIN